MSTHTLLILCAVLLCTQLAGAARDWWNPGLRYRTTVVRPTPWRDAAPRPVEAAIDFPLLLQCAGVDRDFDPATVRVVDPATGTQVPCALRTEWDPRSRREVSYLTWWARPQVGTVGIFDVYFDTSGSDFGPPPARAKLPPENLFANPGFEETDGDLPSGWTISVPELASLGSFAHTTGECSLRLHADADTPEELAREVAVSQTVDVSQFAGCEVLFECDLLAERGKYGTPVTVELVQLREDGSRIAQFAVQPRWLTVEMAEGQLVQFSERGRLDPEAATVEAIIRLRLFARSAFDGTPPAPEEQEYTVWLDRLCLRPGERWPWPSAAQGCFVAGALPDAPVNRAIDFTGPRLLDFNGASEGTLTGGRFNPDPRSVHWGPVRGTLEMWVRPHWSSADEGTHWLFYAKAYGHPMQSQLRVIGGQEAALEFSIVDSDRQTHTVRGPVRMEAERWHHVAATWDHPRAHLQLFLDGALVGSEGPGEQPWPATMDPNDPNLSLGRGIVENDRRSLPMQATIGAGRSAGESADAVLDEVRISDVVRYDGPFEPPRAEFAVDDDTRALFHFDYEKHGTHAGDDRFVEAYLVCEQPPWEEAVPLAVNHDGRVEERMVVIAPRAPEALFVANRAHARMPVLRPQPKLPDPRFVELRTRTLTRTVSGEEEPFALQTGGDFAPLMLWSSFRRAQGAGEATRLIPRWRANDNVVPFTWEDLNATLAPNATTDAERALEIFRYSLQTTNYYDAPYCEDIGEIHRPRVSYTLIRALNIYPFDQCGPMNHMLRKLFLAGGISSNDSPGTHHQFEQAFFDGSLRLFDLSARQYWLDRDNRTIISLRRLGEDPWLKVRQEGDINAWIPGRISRASFGSAERPHRIEVPLRPGEEICFGWHNEGRWMELAGEREPVHPAKIPPFYGNGVLLWHPTGTGEAAVLDNLVLQDGQLRPVDRAVAASVTYRVLLPYVISAARVTGASGGQAVLSVSWNDGASWTELWRGTGAIDADLSPQVMNRYNYWLRIELAPGAEAALADLQVRTTFCVSPLSLPGTLRAGENRMSFVAGPVSEPVEATLAWLERFRSDLGVSLNALSFYLMDDTNHRNLYVARPGQELPVQVTLQGRAFAGEVSLEGLPEGWATAPAARQVRSGGEAVTVGFTLRPEGAAGEIAAFDVVVREGERERRVPAQVLLADAALAAESEAAQIEGDAAVAQAPENSGGAHVELAGDATLSFLARATSGGPHALWVRMRIGQGASTRLGLSVGGEQRELRATSMIGFSDWESPTQANTKLFAHYGEQRDHWAWYRIPDLELSAGEQTIALSAGAGVSFDAALVLPQTPEVDRAAMNLLMTWNFAPWLLPM
ncbi:MAG: LamG domain-containing protein [Armatimonadota bacterium]